jgi:hypothetical protein
MSRNPWIFVVGAPRSGTSLLRRLLSSHARLYISPELRILELVKIAGTLAAAPESGHQVALGRAFGRLLARRQLIHTGSARYGDKYPPYCADMPELAALYPGAQFIHIIRDGRDVASSLARTRAANRGWRRGPEIPPFESLVGDWVSFVLSARHAGATLPAERYHELRYESLLADPIATLAETLRFLGEEVDASTVAGIGEIHPGRSWRETLSPAELLAFHRSPVAESLLERLGYAPTPLPAAGADSGPAGRIAAGGDDPADWSAVGQAALAAGHRREGVAALTRAIRGEGCDRAAAEALLALSDVPESVFAALNLLDDPAASPSLAAWAAGRGLDAEAAAALFGVDAAEVAA